MTQDNRSQKPPRRCPCVAGKLTATTVMDHEPALRRTSVTDVETPSRQLLLPILSC